MEALHLPFTRPGFPFVRPAPEKSGIIAEWFPHRHRAGLRAAAAASERPNSSSPICRSMAGRGGGGTGKARASSNNKTTTVASGQALGKQGAAAPKSGDRARRGEGGGGGSSEPAWPALKKRHLPLQCRRELRGLDLFSVPGFLSPKECESFIQAAETLGFQQQGSLGPRFGEAFRDNGRVSLQSPSLADKLWGAGLSSLFPDVAVDGSRAIGLNPNIRFYRYSVGQRFGQHVDESAEVGGGKVTQYTLLVYLTGGGDSTSEGPNRGTSLVGGETVFYDRRRVVAEVPPVAGTALLHVHGEQCLLHEARVVAKGVKYVMRSDVVFD